MSSSTRKKTILFLAANPKNSTQLRLDQEVREIGEGLQRSQHRKKFQLETLFAVTARDLRRAMLDYKPQIIHFSGHGTGEAGLVLEDDTGQAKLVRGKALAELFQLFAERCNIECVVLNACYSEVQANAIVQYIPYVIGMSQALGDNAAREFAVGFYDALGAGESIEFAYKYGCNSIDLSGIAEELTPILKRKSEAVLNLEDKGKQSTPSDSELRKAVIVDPSHPPAPVSPPIPAPVSPRSLDLETPEGQVPLDSRLYIERPPIEADCYATILREGELIRIKAPRQMGKSSLMQRILNHAKQNGHHTACLHFQVADSALLNDLDVFLQWFCANVSNELNLEDRLENYWKDKRLGSKSNCTNYFQRYLLTALNEPITLALDEVDQVFQHPAIAQDFFGLLRAWHERAKNDALWEKLRLVIVHSKEVYIPLNINQSPFNVGLPIELPELTLVQVQDLAQRHGLNWSETEVKQLMSIVDGHPYLVRKAMYEIARGKLSLSQFVKVAPTDEGLFGDHLRRHLINLNNDPELAAGMRQAIASSKAVSLDLRVAFKLRSMGLVELHGNGVKPLCNLYRLYLRDRLGAS